jgi:hypothetical protein
VSRGVTCDHDERETTAAPAAVIGEDFREPQRAKRRDGEGFREAIGVSNESSELLPRNSMRIVLIDEARSVSSIF